MASRREFATLSQDTRPRTANATEATKHYAAERAIDDPVKLERAARIVRLALARRRITLSELTAPAGGAQG